MSSGRVGVMQGRLSPVVDGRIQAFPWNHWREELHIAQELGFELVEWTLDQDRLHENPLLADPAGVRALAKHHGIAVETVTGDCFMQAPFFKADEPERSARLEDLRAIIDAVAAIGARYIVMPLVDGGSVETEYQQESLYDGLMTLDEELAEKRVAIVFESDFAPSRLAKFLSAYPDASFGVNYDTGNSASLGFDPEEEMAAYGARIVNVHVKDRLLGGPSVPLGNGNVDFPRVFRALHGAGYRGDFVLQTARAGDGDHVGAAVRYHDMTRGWWAQATRR
jgi:hexulose-6-phosphate isomerase